MSPSKQKCIHQEFRENHLVEIFDQGDIRSLYFGGRYLQSRLSLTSPHFLLLPYTQYMTLPLMFVNRFKRILLIGLGAGSLVRFYHHHFPQAKMDVVDHSPYIIGLAKAYFQLPQNDKIRIHCQDGLDFIEQCSSKKPYDLILVDAFNEQGMSDRIYAKPFFLHCNRVIKFNGTLCCNIWSGQKKRVDELTAILNSCFPYCLYLPVPKRGNIIRYCFSYPVPYHHIFQSPKELAKLSLHYSINFRQLTQSVARYNVNFMQRIYHYLRFIF